MRWAEYEVKLKTDIPDLDARVAAILDQASLPRERVRKGKKRSFDLRPLIDTLWRLPGGDLVLGMRLKSSDGATGRPDEVLDAMGLQKSACEIERTRLIFEGN